jgi:hypothetical protein
MHFFSFEPEIKIDRPNIGVGREGMHDWGGARGSAAFLFYAATKAAGVKEGRASLGCLIDCLVWDLFLMTKELCSLLLGMVHAYVDQKLLKSNKIKSFNQ